MTALDLSSLTAALGDPSPGYRDLLDAVLARVRMVEDDDGARR